MESQNWFAKTLQVGLDGLSFLLSVRDRPRKRHLNFVSFQQDLDQDFVDLMNHDFSCFLVPVRETCPQMIPGFCSLQLEKVLATSKLLSDTNSE